MYVYTYKNDVIIPDDAPNNPHDDDESSDDKNDYDYGDTDSMYRIDNFDEPNNTDDASYGDTIAGVEDHEEEPHHEENTNGHQKYHPLENHKQYPPEAQFAPTSEQKMPIDTQTTNNQEDVQEDEVGDSQ